MTATDRETVLVTGASSGIGLELARRFARDGCRLVLAARRAEKLESLARTLRQETGNDAEVVVTDLAAPEAIPSLLGELRARRLEVDILVNNAGVGLRGLFADLSLERQLAMIRLNVTALTELTHRLLPPMRERRRGGVLNVASLAGFVPGPHLSVYYATKAFVLSFTEGLREELAGSGLTISALCPGPVDTEWRDIAGMTPSRLLDLSSKTAAAVAHAGHRGYRRGRAIIVPGALSRLNLALIRVSPRALARKVVKRLQ